MDTDTAHHAHPFTWKKGIRFYQRLKDKLTTQITDTQTNAALPRAA